MNTLCQSIQEEIQSAVDRKMPVTGQVKKHIAGCSTCQNFQKLVCTISEELPNIIQEQSSGIKAVSFSDISKKSRSRIMIKRIIFSASGIAAALVIGFGVFFGNMYMDNKLQQQLVKEETDIFVDSLFENTPLNDVDLSMVLE